MTATIDKVAAHLTASIKTLAKGDKELETCLALAFAANMGMPVKLTRRQRRKLARWHEKHNRRKAKA